MQTINDFLAFKALYNPELSQAIESNDLQQIQQTLVTVYDYETNNNFYTHGKINLELIKNEYRQHVKGIENNPSLIYKL